MENKYTAIVGDASSFKYEDRDVMFFYQVTYTGTDFESLTEGGIKAESETDYVNSDAWVVFRTEGYDVEGWEGLVANDSTEPFEVADGVTLAPGQWYDPKTKEVFEAPLDNA